MVKAKFIEASSRTGQKLYMVRPQALASEESKVLHSGLLTFDTGVRGDLSDHLTFDEIYNEVWSANPEGSERNMNAIARHLHILLNETDVGDLAIVNFRKLGTIAIGEFTGKSGQDKDGKPGRYVKWLRTDIAQEDIAPDLRYSLSAKQRICVISRNDACQRVLRIVKDGTDPGAIYHGSLSDDAEDLEKQLRQRLMRRMAAVFAGHGLADLVAEILKLKGYRVRTSPPGPDGGVDIVAGTGPMGFDTPLVAQIKSGDQITGSEILQQLEGVMKSRKAQNGLLVSWGGFSREARSLRASLWFEVRFWDAEDVLDEYIASYDHLPKEIRDKMPLRKIYI